MIRSFVIAASLAALLSFTFGEAQARGRRGSSGGCSSGSCGVQAATEPAVRAAATELLPQAKKEDGVKTSSSYEPASKPAAVEVKTAPAQAPVVAVACESSGCETKERKRLFGNRRGLRGGCGGGGCR